MKHFIPIVNDVENLLPKALEGCKKLWSITTIIDNRDDKTELKLDLKTIVPARRIFSSSAATSCPFFLQLSRAPTLLLNKK